MASAAAAAEDVLGGRWQPLSDLWRQKQLQYTWLRALMGRHADFWQVTGDALDHALEAPAVGWAPTLASLLTLHAADVPTWGVFWAVALAAALSSGARLVLLDEPTNHLDLEAITAHDLAAVVDRAATDLAVHGRPGAWYRRRLDRHFEQAGSGLWVARRVGLPLYELEGPRR